MGPSNPLNAVPSLGVEPGRAGDDAIAADGRFPPLRLDSPIRELSAIPPTKAREQLLIRWHSGRGRGVYRIPAAGAVSSKQQYLKR